MPNLTVEDTVLFQTMEFSDNCQRRVILDSRMIVQSFTENLDKFSMLAVGTKEAQAEIDVQIEKRERLRRERLLRDLDNSPQ